MPRTPRAGAVPPPWSSCWSPTPTASTTAGTRLNAMGHARPGAAIDDPMSAPDTPISASDLLREFFEQHPRRRG
jgi:poly(3-hydroxybutyrate) depolymerase